MADVFVTIVSTTPKPPNSGPIAPAPEDKDEDNNGLFENTEQEQVQTPGQSK